MWLSLLGIKASCIVAASACSSASRKHPQKHHLEMQPSSHCSLHISPFPTSILLSQLSPSSPGPTSKDHSCLQSGGSGRTQGGPEACTKSCTPTTWWTLVPTQPCNHLDYKISWTRLKCFTWSAIFIKFDLLWCFKAPCFRLEAITAKHPSFTSRTALKICLFCSQGCAQRHVINLQILTCTNNCTNN